MNQTKRFNNLQCWIDMKRALNYLPTHEDLECKMINNHFKAQRRVKCPKKIKKIWV